MTPLHYASQYGHHDIVETLKKYDSLQQSEENSEHHNEVSKLLQQMTKNSKTKFLVPYEIQVVIFSFLDPSDLCNVSSVCKMFHKSAGVDYLWKKMCSPNWETQQEYSAAKSWKERYMIWIRYQIALWKGQELDRVTRQAQAQANKTMPTNNLTKVEALKIKEDSVIEFFTDPPQSDYAIIKLLMIGDAGVGKSSYLLRLADNAFTNSYISTIGVDFKIINMRVDNQPIKLQVWDTAGPERFRTITSSYYRGAMGFFVFYDICDTYTFTNITRWLDEIERYATLPNSVILVGTKCDETAKRQVTTEQGLMLAAQYGLSFFETSAKNDINIRATAEALVVDIIKNRGFFGYRSQYGWPQVVPRLEVVKKMLGIKEETPASTNKAVLATKSRCIVQ